MSDAVRARGLALLYLDSGGGLVVGVVVLAFASFFASLYGMPLGTVVTMGVANLAYASYSGTLAYRARKGTMPSRRAIWALVVANVAWGFVCAFLLLEHARTATLIGLGVVFFEGLYVAGLGLVERRDLLPAARDALTSA